MMGWGPVILGHGHPAISEAIKRQLQSGTLLSLLQPIEVEVAEQLCEMIPCAERVAFGKNGSDVLAAAVRVARAWTKKEEILVFGYHGFHDWYMAVHPQCQGIPEALRELVHFIPYNDIDAVTSIVEHRADRLAAIVMEPANSVLPKDGFLQDLRVLTRKHEVGLIFDEIITGFRVARGGAQEAFGVVPDLACFGKALANGMPLSVLVGPDEYMQALHAVGFGLTYRGEMLSLAAARACLGIIRNEPVVEHLASIGERIRSEFDKSCTQHGIEAQLLGPPSRMTFQFQSVGRITPLGSMTLFVQECLKHGVLTNGNILPSYAHDDRAVEETAAAFDLALAVVGEAHAIGTLKNFLHMPGLSTHYGDNTLEQDGSDSC